jgi:agmatinase
MGYCDLYVSASTLFSGLQGTYEKADYVVLGVPFDATSTFRCGARFAPLAIREASMNIETYDFRTGLDIEDLRLHDLGDLNVSAEADETLRRLGLVTEELVNAGKVPVLIGGEHTISLGALKGVSGDVAVISFDAHLDLRDEYMGRTLSHTTFMRRIREDIKPKEILEIGTRAVCREELDYARKSGIRFFTAHEIRSRRLGDTLEDISKAVANCKKIYMTIDMDVLDPAFVPAVQNPEPEGLDTSTLFDLIDGLTNDRVIAFDVVEVAPHYDGGVTAVQAAKTIFEILCQIEKSRRTTQR